MISLNKVKFLILKYVISKIPFFFSVCRKTNLVRFLGHEKIPEYIMRNVKAARASQDSAYVLIDLGCNVGNASKVFCNHMSIKSHILVDANKSLLDIASRKFPEANPVHAAVGSDNGTVEFYIDPEESANSPHNGSSTKIIRKHWECVVVPQIRLSELLRVHSGDNIIIKMDIEGAETDVLQELIESSIDLNRSILFLEEHRGLMKSNMYNNKLSDLISGLEQKGAHVAFWV